MKLVRRRWTGLALAFLVFAGVPSVCVAPVVAAPTSPAIESKKAQEEAALAELEAKRVELDAKIAEYMTIGRELERTRTEIADLDVKVAAGERKLVQARSALTSRAVEIYRAPRMGMVEVLIGTRSLQDLFARARYLSIISDHDARLMRDYRLTQSENLYPAAEPWRTARPPCRAPEVRRTANASRSSVRSPRSRPRRTLSAPTLRG